MMGTLLKVVVFSKRSEEEVNEAIEDAFAQAAEVNRVCGDYGQVSELMALNNAPALQPFHVSPRLWEVLHLASRRQSVRGAFDPTMGVFAYAWRLSRLDGQLPHQQQLVDNQKGWVGIIYSSISEPNGNKNGARYATRFGRDC